jgi:hypothetical protein
MEHLPGSLGDFAIPIGAENQITNPSNAKNINVATEDHKPQPPSAEGIFLPPSFENSKILAHFYHLLAGSAESHQYFNLT